MAEPFEVLRKFVTEREREAALALARAPAWEAGRQGTGYAKLALDPDALPPTLTSLLERTLAALGNPPAGCFDLYLLRYELGSHIPPHVDPPLLEGALHRRLNAVLEQAERGGLLTLDGAAVPLEPLDAVRFRPDLHRHAVSPIEAGSRLLWSAGCNLPTVG
jgi:hypothetical protein